MLFPRYHSLVAFLFLRSRLPRDTFAGESEGVQGKEEAMAEKREKEARFITVFNQKGGCAKTMTSMQLAGELGRLGLRVYVIDMDPQNTANLWALEADDDKPFPAKVVSLAAYGEAFVDKLGSAVTKYDVIIVDCPPSIGSQVPWISLRASDLALIPVIPVLDNIWASKAAEDLVEKAREKNPALKAAYVLSMVRRGKIFDLCLENLREIARIPILKSQISMRNAFPECQAYGGAVGMFGKSAAADEISSLAEEVAKTLGLRLKKGG